MVAAGEFVKITTGWTVPRASAPVLNTWEFRVGSIETPNALQNVGSYIAAAFVATYITPIRPAFSAQVTLSTISIRSYEDDAEGWDGSSSYVTGESLGALLPRMVTFSVKLQRTEYNIRNGRKGLPGATINNLNTDGSITSGTISTFNAAFDDWEAGLNVEAGDNLIQLSPVILRAPTTPNTSPTVWCYVGGYSLNPDFGTQNSRK